MKADWTKICLFAVLAFAAAVVIAVIVFSDRDREHRERAETTVGDGSTDSETGKQNNGIARKTGPGEAGKSVPIPGSSDEAFRVEVEYGLTTVEREHESREYDANDTVFFSDPDSHLVFNIRTPSSNAMTDLKRWYPRVEAYALANGVRAAVEFERFDHDFEGFGQIRIKLKQAPEHDIRVELIGAQRFEPIVHTLRYTEPFHYVMTSDNPNFAMLKRAHEMDASFRESWWVVTGEEIRMKVAFAKDVDLSSAEAKFREIFGLHALSMNWSSSREVMLSVRLHADATPYPVNFNLGGITDEDGYPLVDLDSMQIYHHAGFSYGYLDPDTMRTTELLRNPQQFYDFLPSDDGSLALAQISQQDETGPSLYVLLDLKQGGKIVEVYKPDRIRYPQWVRDSHSFLYASDKDGANVVEIRDAHTGHTEIFWTSPYHGGNHDGLRWARPYTTPDETRLYVMDHRSMLQSYGFPFTADLYEWESIHDDNPEIIHDFQQGRCEGAACFAAFKVISDSGIFYTRQVEEAVEGPYIQYLYYNPVEHTRTVLELDPEFDLSHLTIHPLDENRALLVQENRKEEARTYSFFVYDPWEKRHEYLFDAGEWTGYSNYGQSIPLGDDRYIVGTAERGAVIDLAGHTLERVDYEPIARIGEFIYWVKRLSP